MTRRITSKIAFIVHLPAKRYRILLDCGHGRSVTAAELKREQLFLGKAVGCAECEPKMKVK
jgi:hypothetical protein